MGKKKAGTAAATSTSTMPTETRTQAGRRSQRDKGATDPKDDGGDGGEAAGRGKKAARPNGTTPEKAPKKVEVEDASMSDEDGDDLAKEVNEVASKLDQDGYGDEGAVKNLFGNKEGEGDGDSANNDAKGKRGMKGKRNGRSRSTANSWTPKSASGSGGGGKNTKNSGNKGGKGASFAPGMKFPRKLTPGGMERKKPKQSGGDDDEDDEPIVIRPNQCVVQVRLKVAKTSSVGGAILALLANGLKILQERDETAAFVCPMDGTFASNAEELPNDFTDFKDEWSFWNEPDRAFYPTIREGKSRWINGGRVVIACTWEPKLLLKKVELKMAEIAAKDETGNSVQFKYADNQLLKVGNRNILFGAPGRQHHLPGIKRDLEVLLERCQREAPVKHPDRYPREEYGGGIPNFELVRDYVKNTPWENPEHAKKLKDKDRVPGWAKQAVQVVVALEKEEMIQGLLGYAERKGYYKELFGPFSWVGWNPGWDAEDWEQAALGLEVERHTAISRSTGVVSLPGIMRVDEVMPFDLEDDEDGKQRPLIMKSLRGIAMNMRVGPHSVRLFKYIGMGKGGIYEGFFTDGKGTPEHKARAGELARCFSAEIKFYLLKRGVKIHCIEALLRKCFTLKARQQADDAKFINGKVYTAEAATRQAKFDRMDKLGLIDMKLGLGASRLLDVQAEEAAREAGLSGAQVDPNDATAFNFNEDLSVGRAARGDESTTYSKAESATLGGTKYEPEDEDSLDSRESAIWDAVESDDEFAEFDPRNQKGGGVRNAASNATQGTKVHLDGMENVATGGSEGDVTMEDGEEEKVGGAGEFYRGLSPEEIRESQQRAWNDAQANTETQEFQDAQSGIPPSDQEGAGQPAQGNNVGDTQGEARQTAPSGPDGQAAVGAGPNQVNLAGQGGGARTDAAAG